MQPLETTINAVELAKSFALHQLITQVETARQIKDYSPLEISLLEELINEILSTITPLEE